VVSFTPDVVICVCTSHFCTSTYSTAVQCKTNSKINWFKLEKES